MELLFLFSLFLCPLILPSASSRAVFNPPKIFFLANHSFRSLLSSRTVTRRFNSVAVAYTTVTVTAFPGDKFVRARRGADVDDEGIEGEEGDDQDDLLQVRQVTIVPSNVPSYARACSGTSRYSSACSCGGITARTTTVPTPTTTFSTTLVYTITETRTRTVGL